MRCRERIRFREGVLSLLFLAATAGLASAETYDLCAGQFNMVMNDGQSVTMWGFGVKPATGCGDAQLAVPGPALEVTGNSLTVNLTNNLSEPVSLHIPGQTLSNNTGPVWTELGSTTPITGARPAGNTTARVRSFSHETAPGATATYTWNTAFKPGSYILQSGTNPAKQVQMGLYAPVKKDTGTNLAYVGVPYTQELLLFFHEIDPSIHTAVAAGKYGYGATGTGAVTSSVHYHARYFLINGRSHPDAGLDPVNTNLILTGDNVLLRFFNAGLETHTPQIEGAYFTLVAEDGIKLKGSREVYGIELPAGKTADALLQPQSARKFPIYDARLNLTNRAQSPGGMLAYLQVSSGGGNTAPVAHPQSVTTNEDTSVAINLTGSDAQSDPLTFAIVTPPARGTLAGTPPSVTYTPNLNINGQDSFTFKANDGALDSAPATISMTVNPVNDPPIANGQAVTTAEDTAKVITLSGSDVDGDTLSYIVGTPAHGSLSGTAPNLTYTPALNYNGLDSFTFQTNDGNVSSTPATVNISVTAVNDPPVITSTPVLTAVVNSPYSYQVVATDPDHSTLFYSLDTSPPNMTINSSGLISWTPTNTGTNPVTVRVSDGALAATQPFTITVNAVPTALLYFSTAGNTAVPGVPGPYDDADIYSWNGTSFARIFTAAGKLTTATDIDAIKVTDTLIYMSFNNDAGIPIPGLGTVQDEDIVTYNPATNTWSLFFDGSDVGLTAGGEDVDAFDVLPDGSVVISIMDSGAVPGIASVADEDLIRCVGTFGPTTTCTWSVYFDGSDVGLTLGSEDIDGVAVAPGKIYLSTLGNYAVTGLTGTRDDVFVCNSPVTGASTSCPGGFSLFFDGSARGITDNLDAIDIP